MQEPEVAILRMEGTNCEEEAYHAFQDSGFKPTYIHINELKNKRESLEHFSTIFLPGGFSAGDYIRAGSIFSARLSEYSRKDLERFVDEGKPIIGVCNGFQILAELGFIPDLDGKMERKVGLAPNSSNRFECRMSYVKMTGKTPMLKEIKHDLPYMVPVAHAEGRIVTARDQNFLEKLDESGQIIFRYSNPDGTDALYPWNPNGSEGSIAGLSNFHGNVIGLMPHPERIYNFFGKLPSGINKDVLGKNFFDSLYNYILKKAF
ncbi:phosphoribosylformylglycinamidine synthase subunit PurQ [Oxyplasma meridianum]|uniref:Phosphoribosylformylglycinamidine synthase subunit PurQ n=1 Tax=Oxyplasma meridianum TaxID=3073602 RepID=A0AAX4NG51_9ARCH